MKNIWRLVGTMSMEVNAYNNYAKETVNNCNSASKKESTASKNTQYKDVSEYARSLQKQYNYFNAKGSASGVPTTVKVPLSLLQDCMRDPEKAANLEKSLKQIPDLINNSKLIAGSCGCKITEKVYMVDADGNLSGVITTCAGLNDSSSSGNIERKAEEERIARRKAAEKEQEERLAKQREERNAEKEAAMDAIREAAQSQEFTFFAKDAVGFREKLMEIMEKPLGTSISVSGMIGFDMKA